MSEFPLIPASPASVESPPPPPPPPPFAAQPALPAETHAPFRIGSLQCEPERDSLAAAPPPMPSARRPSDSAYGATIYRPGGTAIALDDDATAAAPATRPRPSLRLHWISLLLIALHVVVMVLLQLTDMNGGFGIVGFMFMCAIPPLVAIGVGAMFWIICRRSQLAYNIPVGILMGGAFVRGFLMLAGPLNPAPAVVVGPSGSDDLPAIVEPTDVRRDRAVRAMQQGGAVSSAGADARAELDRLASAGEQLEGVEGAVVRATAAASRPWVDLDEQYRRKLQAFLDSGALALDERTVATDLERRLAALGELAAVNDDLDDVVTKFPDALRRAMLGEGVDTADVGDAVGAILDGMKYPVQRDLRNSQTEFIEAATACLELMRERHGTWSVGADGIVAFQRQADATTFNRILERIQLASAAEQQATAQLVAPGGAAE